MEKENSSNRETGNTISVSNIDKNNNNNNSTSIQRDYESVEYSHMECTPEIDVEVVCTARVENWPELSCLLRSYVRLLFIHSTHSISPGALLDMSNASHILNSCIYSVRICDLTSSHTLSLLSETSESVVRSKQIIINLIFYRLFGLHCRNNNYSSKTIKNHSPRTFTKHETQTNMTHNKYMPKKQLEYKRDVNDCKFNNNYEHRFLEHEDEGEEEDDYCHQTTTEECGLYSNTNDTDNSESCAFCTMQLPHASLDGLWESLSYGESLLSSQQLKSQLLNYVRTTLHFIAANIDPNRIAWNRMILFYGPPGTGKTSLARALAHKIAIRCRSTFTQFKLVEINAHSVFSRWFSESGKQVVSLFNRIKQLATSSSSSSSSSMSLLLFVVIDEVESLAATRESAMKGNEPSDAIRVVNALLTQIDQLQRIRNVFVITTSNLTSAIDSAFLDRADLQLYIGPPGLEARKVMLMASVQELLSRKLLQCDFLEGKTNALKQTSTIANKQQWCIEQSFCEHQQEQEQEEQSEEMSEVGAATVNMVSEYSEEQQGQEHHEEKGEEACYKENYNKENVQNAQRRRMTSNASEQSNFIPNYVTLEVN